jgi:hypothetical protein
MYFLMSYVCVLHTYDQKAIGIHIQFDIEIISKHIENKREE